MINPFIKNRKLLLIYFLLWVFIAVAHSLILTFIVDVSFGYSIIDSIIFNGLYCFLGLSFWYMVNFNSLDNYSAFKIILNHIASAFIITTFWLGISYFILSNIIEDKKYLSILNSSLVWRSIAGIMFYIIIIAIDYVLIYYNNFHDKLLKEAELKTLLKETELRSLKYQINPHFIFNSLNSISSLTLSNPAKAREMTIKLSTFLRSTLSRNENQTNPLKEELENSRLYLDIEKVRFGDKFDYVEECDDECGKVEVPAMLLQPLFENAIKHGVYESVEKVTIKLKCKKGNGFIQITMENNYDPEAVPRKGEGIGLKNIKNRLKLFYNNENLITIDKDKGLFRVDIYIPEYL
ncbi:sensor histidine kinase [Melioribacter sp. OK-6-Me]|uniref:sensor histidine kinase n=1 Tax=unclassified Melioribacter TaxID=2627329 RepID=UPI003ED98EED